MDKAILLLKKAQYGPGGIRCSCCNPRFGKFRGEGSQENRKKSKRALRRNEKQRAKREIRDYQIQSIRDWVKEYNQDMIDLAMYNSLVNFNSYLGILEKAPALELDEMYVW